MCTFLGSHDSLGGLTGAGLGAAGGFEGMTSVAISIAFRRSFIPRSVLGTLLLSVGGSITKFAPRH